MKTGEAGRLVDKSESIQKLIGDVDECFDKNWAIKIRVVWLRFFFAAISIGTFLFAYYFSRVGAQAAVAGMLELAVGIDGVAVATGAFGLVIFGMILSKDWQSPRIERLRGRTTRS